MAVSPCSPKSHSRVQSSRYIQHLHHANTGTAPRPNHISCPPIDMIPRHKTNLRVLMVARPVPAVSVIQTFLVAPPFSRNPKTFPSLPSPSLPLPFPPCQFDPGISFRVLEAFHFSSSLTPSALSLPFHLFPFPSPLPRSLSGQSLSVLLKPLSSKHVIMESKLPTGGCNYHGPPSLSRITADASLSKYVRSTQRS